MDQHHRSDIRKIISLMCAAVICLTSCLALVSCGGSDTSGGSGEEPAASDEAGSVDIDSAVISDYTEMDDGALAVDVFAMDTYMTLKVYGDNREEALDKATEEILRIDALLSTGSENSEVTKLNKAGGGSLSEDTEFLVERSLAIYRDTDGLFDITIYPVMKLWGFTDQNYRVPDDDELSAALDRVDASQISLEQDKITLGDSQEIDLGGIAKGYTSARVMEIFEECGVSAGLVSLGGNVQSYGTKTDGSDWKVAVRDPEDDSNYLGVIRTHDQAVITSGGYERFFEEDGKTYHHIIDPSTGYPAENGIISSTIISDDGTLADGLSTSLFVMGAAKASEYWDKHRDEFDFILETSDHKVYVTEGIADKFDTDLEVILVK